MDTGQVDTEYFEDQMRQTRVRLDRKLDALNARTSGARQQMSWAMPALAGVIGAAVWMRARRRRRAKRWSDVNAAPEQYGGGKSFRRSRKHASPEPPASTRREPPWLYHDASYRWP